jgi:hypothetical protein
MDEELGDEQWGADCAAAHETQGQVDLGLLKVVDRVRVPDLRGDFLKSMKSARVTGWLS